MFIVESVHVAQRLQLLEMVRCLECGEVYAKPVGGGTLNENPGCPHCGYVGWLSISLPRAGRRRSGAGRLLRRPVRSS
jgi:hypothetical protein